MAQKVQVELVDDLDGSPAAETVLFALDGKSYEIDLSPDNAKELRDGLADFVNAARKQGARPASNVASRGAKSQEVAAARAELNEIRNWARENGYRVSDRGRIPVTIQDAYRNRVIPTQDAVA